MIRPLTFVGLALLVACGSTASDGQKASDPASGDQAKTDPPASTSDPASTPAEPEVDHGAPSDVYPAPHAAMPKVITDGGPVLKAPHIVPIFFAGDTNKDELTAYAKKMGKSSFWSANVAEYGVGELTAGDAIVVNDTPPANLSDTDIVVYLKSKLDGTHPEFGDKPIPDAIYTIYYPGSTTITLGSGGFGGGTSCQEFGGYHDSFTVNMKSVAYAVIPECDNFAGVTGVDVMTSTSSHEWIEAATDPFPMSNPAFSSIDDEHVVWSFLLGGSETGDMCAQDPESFYVPTDIGHMVQRSWSNKAAAASHDPCVPAPADQPYFNAAPVMNDDIKLSGMGQSVSTKGIKIPVGETKTIELDLFSDMSTGGPWAIKARSLDYGGEPTLDVSLDRDQGQNGEKVYLTVKALKKSQYGASAFIISNRLNGRRTSWVGIVGN